MTAVSDPTATEITAAEVTMYDAEEEASPSGERRRPGRRRRARPPRPRLAPAASVPDPVPAHPRCPFLRKRLVYGRYRSAGGGYELELRVDVGGSRPMNRFSADFFYVSGATQSYFGSFRVDAPTITTTATEVQDPGHGNIHLVPHCSHHPRHHPAGHDSAACRRPRLCSSSRRPTSLVRAICVRRVLAFRSIQFEQDSVAGTIPFVSYDTGRFPNRLGARRGARYGLGSVPSRRDRTASVRRAQRHPGFDGRSRFKVE